MHETIKEGKALIKIKKADKVSRAMEVFYNPVMKHNRDISILLLDAIENKRMQIALPLEASGVRGIRLLKELGKGKIKSISFNDYSKKATESIKDNLRLNSINIFSINKKISQDGAINKNSEVNKKNINKAEIGRKIRIYNEDATMFLLKSSGFDYIDLDPFGTSNPFLDAAIKRISRNGILAVTNTDTAALTGTYLNACVRKYWAAAKRDYMMHETGLRILIRKIQLIGMQYEKALVPIFSYFKDHYFRIFFRCIKGKNEADIIARQHAFFNGAGPLWIGGLWDKELTIKMHTLLLNISKTIRNNGKRHKNDYLPDRELLKFIKTINEEAKVDIVGFYCIHDAAGKLKIREIPTKEEIIKKIEKLGYKATATHFSGTGIRSNIPRELFLKLVNPIKE